MKNMCAERASLSPITTRWAVALVAVVALAGCGTETAGGGKSEVAGLTSLGPCSSPDTPVAAFWGSDEGVGFPDDRNGAPPGGDIWGLLPDGQNSALTDDARSRDPSLSDDALRLYFTRSDGGLRADIAAPGTTLWKMDLVTREETQLFVASDDTALIEDMEESPDGRQLAFTAQIGDAEAVRPRVYLLDLDGTDEPTVVPMPSARPELPRQWQASPTWSFDGTSLAYILVSNDDTTGWQSSIQVVDLATGNDSTLYEPASKHSYLHGLQWSAAEDALLVVEQTDEAPVDDGFVAVSIDARTGERSVLVDRVPDSVTYSGSDGRTVSAIGLTSEQLENPELPQEPAYTTWVDGEATVEELATTMSFALQLNIPESAYMFSESEQ